MTNLILVTFMVVFTFAMCAAQDIPFKHALDAAAIVQSNKRDNIAKNALVIGNGDLNALVYAPQGGAVILRVTKNDVWDARADTSGDPAMIKMDVKDHKWEGGTNSPSSWRKPYPQPRAVGLVQVGIDGATGERGWTSTLDLRNASARFKNKSGGGSNIIVRALAQKNAFLILGDGPISLTGIKSADLPAVERGEKNGVQWIKQVLPGDLDYRGMEFAMAAGSDGKRHVVAVVTSWDPVMLWGRR